MITKIEIDCEDLDELILHLKIIKLQIKRKFREFSEGSFMNSTDRIDFEDNNCYGTHKVSISDDRE